MTNRFKTKLRMKEKCVCTQFDVLFHYFNLSYVSTLDVVIPDKTCARKFHVNMPRVAIRNVINTGVLSKILKIKMLLFDVTHFYHISLNLCSCERLCT